MTKAEKMEFVNSLLSSVKYSILNKVPIMPQEWDGQELRRYIVDYVSENVCVYALNGKRLKDYKNKVMVRNL